MEIYDFQFWGEVREKFSLFHSVFRALMEKQNIEPFRSNQMMLNDVDMFYDHLKPWIPVLKIHCLSIIPLIRLINTMFII